MQYFNSSHIMYCSILTIKKYIDYVSFIASKKILVVFIALFSLSLSCSYSQTSTISVILEDQYGTKVKDASVIALSNHKPSQTNENGIFSIEVMQNDSIIIDKKHFSKNPIAINIIINLVFIIK